MIPVLERRRIATQATIDRFAAQPFVWGRFDCAKMAAFHLRHLGVRVGIAKSGQWQSALGARRALGRMGVASLSELADRHLDEIAPAATLIGDIVIASGDEGHEALWIAVGNGAALGWSEWTEGAAILRMSFVETRAWSVL